MNLKNIIIAITLILGFSLSCCKEKSSPETQEEQHEEASNLVELTEAQYALAKITLGKIDNFLCCPHGYFILFTLYHSS